MVKQPLLVHLLFHPGSGVARDLARHIHVQLNDDLLVPGLRIPTVFCPLGQGKCPPARVKLDWAQHSFVVVLADDELAAEDDWCSLVAEQWLTCENSPHRCVPMQLSENAWPLDARLRSVNFGRAFAQPDKTRTAWVARRVVIELCRFLQGWEAAGDKSRAPTQLFLSHAKADLSVEPKVAQQFIDYLRADQPVDAWVDSGDIETGSRFAEAITNGVKRTSVLSILTDHYSSREWCREEVMLAKEHQRPIAIVDALMNHEVRSFPFLDNVPRLRWNGSPEPGIDLLLKETLRHLHTQAVLDLAKQPGDTIFLRPPEPATLLGVPAGSKILYSDPPLGAGELRRLMKSNATFATPLERAGQNRSLVGKLIALSMSESSDIARWGLDEVHQQQTMLELSRHLLIRGASLAYGGHLGGRGYTQQLFELVRTHNNQEGVQAFERIINHRGWPLPRLSSKERSELNQVSKIIALPRPADVDESLHPDFIDEPAYFPGDRSPEHRYAWCRGMTEMRKYQADRSKSRVAARIVLGGTFEKTIKVADDGTSKESWYSSRMPGVLEEIVLSIQAGQPVFLIGAFGGVAKLAIDLLLGKGHPAATWEVQSKAPFARETRELYAARGQSWWYYGDEPRVPNLPVDHPLAITLFLREAWKPNTALGWETGINPLTREQNLALFETVDIAEMVELLVNGLAQCPM